MLPSLSATTAAAESRALKEGSRALENEIKDQ